MKRNFFLGFILVASALVAHAEDRRDEWVLRDKAKTSDEKVNAASDASFDKRLPPVLPGEEVNDSGKRMKVWSTSGMPDEPSNVFPASTPAAIVPGSVGIVIDERRDRRRDAPR